jgi:hypothetical protein
VAIATFHEQPQTLFSDQATPVRDRGWVTCPHGTSWPSESFVTRPAFFDGATFKNTVFANHQRRFPDCDCTLADA